MYGDGEAAGSRLQRFSSSQAFCNVQTKRDIDLRGNGELADKRALCRQQMIDHRNHLGFIVRIRAELTTGIAVLSDRPTAPRSIGFFVHQPGTMTFLPMNRNEGGSWGAS